MSRYTRMMMQRKNLSGKSASSISAVRAVSGILLCGAMLMTVPLPARGEAAAASTSSGPASAATAAPANSAAPPASEEVPLPQSHVPTFADVDTNHDGKIEWKEAQAVKVSKKVFDQFDFDHNGVLSETEWLFVRLHMTDFTPPKGTTSTPATATK